MTLVLLLAVVAALAAFAGGGEGPARVRLPPHLLAAVRRGEGALFRGRVYTSADLAEIDVSEPAGASELAEIDRLRAEASELRTEIDRLRAGAPRPAEGETDGETDGETATLRELVDALAPRDEAKLSRLDAEQLRLVHAHRFAEFAGDRAELNKRDMIADLLGG